VRRRTFCEATFENLCAKRLTRCGTSSILRVPWKFSREHPQLDWWKDDAERRFDVVCGHPWRRRPTTARMARAARLGTVYMERTRALRVLVANNLAWDAEARVIARMSLVKVRFCCGKATFLTLRGQRRGRALSLRPAWAAGERLVRM
jgi:hypothetical protein